MSKKAITIHEFKKVAGGALQRYIQISDWSIGRAMSKLIDSKKTDTLIDRKVYA